MREYNMKFKEALKLVAKKRMYVSPNEGFIKELETYEKKLFGQWKFIFLMFEFWLSKNVDFNFQSTIYKEIDLHICRTTTKFKTFFT